MPQFLTPADFNKIESRQFVLQNLASAPASPAVGQVYWDTANTRAYVWTGAAWQLRATLADDASALGGQNSAWHRDRANHTGTQTAASISDFTTTARAAITVADSATLDLTYSAGGQISGAVLDSPTVGGATPANLRDRSTHTGTQTASTISNFDTQVRTSRLDQMAVPTAAVNVNNQKITNLANGTNPADAVNFSQLEAARQGIRSKDAVDAAMTTNVAVAAPGAGPFDGQTLVAGERILLMGQTTASENGIWTWNGAAVPMTRAADADTFAELDSGTETFAQGGTANQGVWRQTAELTAFTGQTWIKVNGGTTYTAGSGLAESPAGTFNVGSGTGISVTADAIAIDTAVVARKVSFNVGGATAVVLTHNLNTRDVNVEVYLNSGTYERVFCEVEHTDLNTVTLRFSVAPGANAYRAIVVG